MARVYAALASTAIDPSQYDISNSGLYTKQVYDLLNRKIGNTLYIKNMAFKDAALLKNPLKRRYEGNENATPMVGGPNIGERYNVYDNLGRQIVFLDDVNGLTGFTYEEGYKESPNASVQTHMEDMKRENPVFNKEDGEEIDFYKRGIEKSGEDIKKDFDEIHNEIKGNTVLVKGNKKTYASYEENEGIVSKEENHLEYDTIELDYLSSANGLLGKTNQLFSEGKIQSMINRKASSDNGISRGRNLKNSNGDYVRVWTISDQYTKLKQTIKPKDNDGNIVSSLSKYQNENLNIQSFRPNNGASRLEKHTSLGSNGLPIIAPTNAEEVKKCMFSIENLAWKDINFENKILDKVPGTPILSDGQRGENGGRIMWFPPYNLKFNENVSINWESNAFIGRGENVYTYNNTERTGQLDFTILVDHPSAMDKWGRYADENVEENEQQLLRFLSGEGDLEDSTPGNNEEEEKQPTQVVAEPIEPVKEPFTIKYFLFFPYGLTGIDWMSDQNTLLEYLHNGYEQSGKTLTSALKQTLIDAGWKYETDLRNIYETVCKEDNWTEGLNDSKLLYSGITDTGSTLRDYLNCSDLSDKEVNLNIHSFNDLVEGDLYGTILAYGSGYDISIVVKGYDDIIQVNADDRGRFVYRWILKQNFTDSDKVTLETGEVVEGGIDVVNGYDSKVARRVEVTVNFTPKSPDLPSLIANIEEEIRISDEELIRRTLQEAKKEENRLVTLINRSEDTENIENEYNYFKHLTEEDPIVIKNLVKKIKYFSPAFHSITPEGFNARLTFLNQCTRQGPTLNNADKGIAGNLAFGRPPVCVLRIGDFYNTKIIINSLSITYESDGGIQWDMNQAGIGLQPMMANVSLGFTFLGGSDLGGPIARLQNAISENYYANTSIYSERADWKDEKTTKLLNITDTGASHKDYNF